MSAVPERAIGETGVDPLVAARLRAALHEIRQPLAAVFALAELARNLPGAGEDVRTCLAALVEQAQAVAAAAASVLDPSGPDTGDERPADLGAVLDSVLDGFRLTWTGTLTRHGAGGALLVDVSRTMLRRSLVNVIDNAVRAAGPGGRVTVGVHRHRDGVSVVVEDDGPGLGSLPTRTGLGLALTRGAVASMGGALSLGLPSRAGGARLRLTLPATADGLPTTPDGSPT